MGKAEAGAGAGGAAGGGRKRAERMKAPISRGWIGMLFAAYFCCLTRGFDVFLLGSVFLSSFLVGLNSPIIYPTCSCVSGGGSGSFFLLLLFF